MLPELNLKVFLPDPCFLKKFDRRQSFLPLVYCPIVLKAQALGQHRNLTAVSRMRSRQQLAGSIQGYIQGSTLAGSRIQESVRAMSWIRATQHWTEVSKTGHNTRPNTWCQFPLKKKRTKRTQWEMSFTCILQFTFFQLGY